MNEPHDPNATADIPSVPADALDAGLAAGFGRPVEAPRSSLDASQRPLLLREAKGESDHVVKPCSDAMPDKSATGDRYLLFGEIARGGMGAVLRGRDVDLGRDLAVKVLLEKHADRPEVARRFLEEAQIGGQLQHPGVVPVYDVGRFGERPFFTMKLVKGLTLAHLLAERADYTRDRPRLLAIALQVAQALAYAHAKGVIHRDLKPANIMVGAFGEVQVMDWGLAKVLAEGGVADEERASRQHQTEEGTLIRTARSRGTAGSVGTDTEAGALLGTPAYMPPEQANGDVAHLDRRADVFGLGAILCEVLTGKPPYVGRSTEEVRRKAANGDLADATRRLDGCGADAELIVLTKACLSPEALDRPKDAQAVADGLTAYLDGVQQRLRQAELAQAAAQAKAAEEAKRRRVQLALLAAVAVLLLGVGAFAWWQNEQAQIVRERHGRNAEAVAALLDQCEEALRKGDAARAAVTLEAARKRAAEGGADKLAERLAGLGGDLALLRDLDVIDQLRWTPVENKLPDAAAVATRYREALRRFGADPDAVSADEAAARVSASAVRERIVMALDRRLREQKAAGVRAVLGLVDANPYRDAVRDAVRANNRAKVAELAGQPAALEQPPGFAAFLGDSGAIGVERRRQLLQVAVRRWPGDLGVLMTLGGTYPFNQEDGANERLRWYQAAVAAAPANPAAHNNLGITLSDKKDLAGAEAAFREAIRLGPKHATAHYNLGVALSDKKDLAGAEAAHREAIRLDPKNANAHTGLGNVLSAKKDLAGAEAAHREAIRLDPTSAGAHYNLGLMLHAKKDLAGAEAAFRQAIRLDPTLAKAHIGLGIVLDDKKDLAGAEAAIREAIRLDPKYALAHYNLGNVLSVTKDLAGAEAACREAIRLEPKDAQAHIGLGAVLGDKKELAGAEAAFREAIRLDPTLATAHNNLGITLSDKKDLAGAEAAFREAIRLDPTLATAHYSLGIVLYAKKGLAGAEAAYRQAIRLDSKYAEAHCNLGHTLSRQGRFAESLAALQRGHELGTKQSGWPYPSGRWVREAERLAALEGKLPAFLKGKLKPKDAAERLGLAGVCQAKQFHHAATRLYADAFAADPKLAPNLQAQHRYNAACAAALAAADQGEDTAKLDDAAKAKLRSQALDWLKADRTALGKLLASGPPQARPFIVQTLSHWQKDNDLAGLRDAAALAKLPAEEQKACTQLWAEVAELLKKAETPATKEDKK